MIRTFRSLHAAVLLSAIVAGGCERSRPQQTPVEQRGGTVVIAGINDLDYANSLVSADRYTLEVLRFALFLPLVQHDEKLAFRPALASSWDQEGDTATVFHLRRDVRWSDGAPTTAYDVLFTLERALNPQTGFPNGDYLAGWRRPAAIDSFTIRISYERQPEPLAGLPFLPIMPKHALDSIPAERMRQAAFNHQPVTNGPFRFVSYRANDRWILEANDSFPAELGGRPNIDRLVWRVIPENSAQTTELLAGGVQVVLKPLAKQFTELKTHPSLTAVIPQSRQYSFIAFNGRRKPLNDARVRRAIIMALDRTKMINALRDGYGTLATGPVGPYHWAFARNLQPLPYAPDSSRALLERAGLERSSEGKLQIDGKPFEIEMKYPASSDFNRDVTEMIRADLAAVGITVRPRPEDWNSIVGQVTNPARQFDTALMAWEADFRVNLRDLFSSSALKGPLQFASYSNPEVDRLIEQVAHEPDRARAGEEYARLQEILLAEQPWGFLFYFPDLYLFSKRVHDAKVDIRGALVNVGEWWISPQ